MAARLACLEISVRTKDISEVSESRNSASADRYGTSGRYRLASRQISRHLYPNSAGLERTVIHLLACHCGSGLVTAASTLRIPKFTVSLGGRGNRNPPHLCQRIRRSCGHNEAIPEPPSAIRGCDAGLLGASRKCGDHFYPGSSKLLCVSISA